MEWVIGILIFLGILIASVFLAMKGATDLPKQQNTLKQQTPLNKEKSNLIWKVIFITLLFVNIIFVFWVGNVLSVSGHTEDLSGIVALYLSLPLAIIDLIAVLYYTFTHLPLGKVVNSISTSIFFALSFFLITFAWSVVSGGLGINPNRDTKVEYVMIAAITALFSFLFSRYMSHK